MEKNPYFKEFQLFHEIIDILLESGRRIW